MVTSPLAFVPAIPENAPFTPEQRAWLNGFLAGLFSCTPVSPAVPAPPALSAALEPLSILFGSQTGNAEALAKRAAQMAGRQGYAPTVSDLANYDPKRLTQESNLLIITSTYGNGEPPDNAKAFWTFLENGAALDLSRLRFSVCALGDSNYEQFCQFGRDLDQRLAACHAQRVHARVDCDVDFETAAQGWLEGALQAFRGTVSTLTAQPVSPQFPAADSTASTYSRSNPFPATLAANRVLNAPGSLKETRHFEIALDGSDLRYQAGDALGVYPVNCPRLVAALLEQLGIPGETTVPGASGRAVAFEEALTRHYEITRIPKALVALYAQTPGGQSLKPLCAPDANGDLDQYLRGRDLLDLVTAYPAVKLAPADFIGALRKLAPRLYSISSSPNAHPEQAHLTVGVVRYETLNRERRGVCSSFLAGGVQPGTAVPVFIQPNPNFRPPTDPQRPAIMVGPGTGVAPFRAFLQERQARGDQGKNWLFFGDQRSATDFLYRDELETMMKTGTLTRLDTAFSRDQPEKVYVQDRIRDHAWEVFHWLEDGSHFYVCGDASRMAKDVDAALHEAIQIGGDRTPDQAVEYVNRLKSEKRYQRDVY